VKLFHWLVTVPIAVILIVFAVANRDPITLTFWPLPVALTAPTYIVVLLTLLVGFLLGELVAWINGRNWRREARHNADRIRDLERERAAQTPPKEASKEIARN
jgi:uncharacterized integral membrane protein